MEKKTQISFEFILIFSLVLVVLIGFFYIIKVRITEISEEKEDSIIRNLANSIKNEVMLASSVNNKYLRRFDIPYRINGKEYKMYILNDELTINLFENNEIVKTYFTVFPVRVKGTFVEKLMMNTTKHCITKTDIDGIRISQNQASIDALERDTYRQDEIDIEVNANEEFYLLMSLNCVENLRSVHFTISYDSAFLELLEVSEVDKYKRELNPLFESVILYNYEGRDPIKINDEYYDYITDGRYTFGMISEECSSGSGTIAQFKFKAKAVTEKTEVGFEELFGDKNLRLLDCNTNEFTKENLPDTKKAAIVRIN